jgi:DNA invertase Pin-like site-specific DNA recombinase
MLRAIAYARYSSDHQRDASIEDQVRVCRALIEREGWQYLIAYSDHAASGASSLRPGYQKLLEDARAGAFEVVVAEALDRLSRDQADTASLYKQLTFHRIRLVTLAEGEISELHVGLKGTMNALYLKDLADKTRRGLEGRVRQGRSGGGVCYGYDVVEESDTKGGAQRGGRRINEAEAGVVRRIFKAYADGLSPRMIAQQLNAEGIAGPRGRPWGPSTIYGNWRRGTGILNNELYVGRLVWNRQRFIKDPATGRRQARLNPPEAWIIEEVPQLHIVEEALWEQVKLRQKAVRATAAPGLSTRRPADTRRPRYLLSGLIKCGLCGSGFSVISRNHLGCSGARARGICDNRLTIRREVLEESVLSGLKTHLMRPELVREFIAEFQAELARLNGERQAQARLVESEFSRVKREIAGIMSALKAGIITPGVKEELLALEARKAELERKLATTAPELPAIHPGVAEIYRRKVEHLREAIDRADCRAEAAEILRGLIEEVRLVPEDDELQIELHGELSAILELANEHPRRASAGVQIKLVAGACNHRELTLPSVAV